jgi:hypothetical protein
MKILIAAIHGIMTNQTDPSWPDKFDAWMFQRDPEVKVLKKEYRAGPFPRWNCWVKDPLLAHSLANELELFVSPKTEVPSPKSPLGLRHQDFGLETLEFGPAPTPPPPIWFVAHSNGAVIALLTAQRLIQRGHRIGGMILTGAASEADICKNHVLEWYGKFDLRAAIAYSSKEDQVLAGDARTETGWLSKIREGLWARCLWPYGCLGRTGWICEIHSSEFKAQSCCEPVDGVRVETLDSMIFTRWYSGGHGGYFDPQHLERTFEQIYRDVKYS